MLVLSGYGFMPFNMMRGRRNIPQGRPDMSQMFSRQPSFMSRILGKPSGMPPEAMRKMQEARERAMRQVEVAKKRVVPEKISALRLAPSQIVTSREVEYEPEYYSPPMQSVSEEYEQPIETDDDEFSGMLSGREYLKSFYRR